MNTWRNLPGKIWVTVVSLEPRLRSRSRHAARMLSPHEGQLFLAMSRYDLAHSMAVAARLKDEPLLHRAGLLHDAGKLRSEASIFTRWLYTAMELLVPKRLQHACEKVEERARGEEIMERVRSLPRGWRRGIYVQLHHGEIAAQVLAGLGSDGELIRLVGSHQHEPCDELERRLREIDDSL
jgi:hypothetical protein